MSYAQESQIDLLKKLHWYALLQGVLAIGYSLQILKIN